MTDYENILVETEASGVATITLNRPEKLNALSEGLRNDLEAALRELNPGDAVRSLPWSKGRRVGERTQASRPSVLVPLA